MTGPADRYYRLSGQDELPGPRRHRGERTIHLWYAQQPNPDRPNAPIASPGQHELPSSPASSNRTLYTYGRLDPPAADSFLLLRLPAQGPAGCRKFKRKKPADAPGSALRIR